MENISLENKKNIKGESTIELSKDNEGGQVKGKMEKRLSKSPEDLIKEYKELFETDQSYIIEDGDKVKDIENRIQTIKSEIKGSINWLKTYEGREDYVSDEKYESNKDEFLFYDEIFPGGYEQSGDVIPEDTVEEDKVVSRTRDIFRIQEGKIDLLEYVKDSLEDVADLSLPEDIKMKEAA